MIFAIISAVFWTIMLIKDTGEFIAVRNVWGKEHGHKTFIVVDIMFLLFSVWAAYMLR